MKSTRVDLSNLVFRFQFQSEMLMIELPSQQKKAASIPSLNNTTEKEQIRQWPFPIVVSIPLIRVVVRHREIKFSSVLHSTCFARRLSYSYSMGEKMATVFLLGYLRIVPAICLVPLVQFLLASDKNMPGLNGGRRRT